RRGESALREGDTYRCRGGHTGHHHDRQPLPSGPATHLGLHISSFSDVHLLALTDPCRRLSRAGMGEVLRPREGERPYSSNVRSTSPAITPERQPLVAPD